MLVSLTVPDEVFEKYAKAYPKSARAGMIEQLRRFQDISPTTREVLLHGEPLSRIEKAMGKPVEDPAKFASDIEAAYTINMGDFKITLTPSQRKRLVAESAFYKENAGTYLSRRLGSFLAKVIGY